MGRWPKRMWGRRLWWEMLMEENQAAKVARLCCWVTHRGWSHHCSLSAHAITGSWKTEKDPRKAGLYCLEQERRTLPGWPFKCLTCWAIEKGPSQDRSLSAWMGQATERHQPKRPSDCQLPEVRKYSNRVIAPVAEAVNIPAHLASPGSPWSKQLHHLNAQFSLAARG